MDEQVELSRLDESRAALRALSRTALQARAKKLGVRANRKSIDIIEVIVKAQTLAGPRAGAAEVDGSSTCCAADERGATSDEEDEDNAENVDPAALPSNSNDTPVAARPALKCAPSPAPTGTPAVAARSVAPDTSPAATDSLFTFAAAPLHTAASAHFPTTAAATTPTLSAKAAAPAAHAAAAPHCLPAATTTPKLSDLAAHASALALAAKLTSMRLESSAAAGPAPASQLRAWTLLPRAAEPLASLQHHQLQQDLPPAGPAAQAQAWRGPDMGGREGVEVGGGCAPSSGSGGAVAVLAATPLPAQQREQGEENEAVRRLAFGGASPQPGDGGEPSTAAEAAQGPAQRCAAMAAQACAAPHAPASLALPPPGATVKATAVHITARTPLRQQRLLGVGLAPPALLGPTAATPGAQGPIGTGGATPLLLPRTPAAGGLRTPARRVAVCTDEAQARALDAWVLQHLLTPAGAAPGLQWRDLVGLDSVKQRLQVICGTVQAEGCGISSSSSPLTGQPAAGPLTVGSPAPGQASSPHQPPPMTRPAAPASVTPPSTTRAARSSTAKPGGVAARSSSSSSSSSNTSQAGGDAVGQGRADRTGLSRPPPAAARSLSARSTAGGSPCAPSQPAPAAAVLLHGPAGVGKGCLARALAAGLGASYIGLADLAERTAPYGFQAHAVLRAAFRVASQTSGPVVVHLADVEQLVGAEALEKGQEQRRVRTELMVAVDELLLQPRARRSPAATGKPLSVVVLSTSSRPLALDDALASCLGRTDRLLALLPDSDAREALLVGQLAAEGADLGVEQVVRLARQTEGMPCAEIKAACDRAVVAAAARREARPAALGSGRRSGTGSRIPGPQPAGGAAASSASAAPTTPLCEGDMVAAISVGRRTAPQEVTALELWHERLGAVGLPPMLQTAR
ncbi:Fidgetin [Tetrabaena socialis]|uniref:Fidgetin n=1 Tax=Tetrabaena socialis TaxID=47790 RepID=A0A2J8AHJ1_9CHLO|nr:Fidgetin [Tetrabaena socialis]|eukprot:PNH11976.1 Fidgetin [Tetrabaena socialis]